MDAIGFKVELTGEDKLDQLAREVKDLNNTKIDIKLGTSIERELKQVNKWLDTIADTLAKTYFLQLDTGKAENNAKGLKEQIETVNSVAEEASEVNLDTSKAEANVRSLKDMIASIADVVGDVGGALENLGDSFGGNLLSKVEDTLVALGTATLSKGMSGAGDRFDILSTYTDYINLMGFATDEADASLEKINKNIQGLPLGLSDVAQQTRMYTMYLEDGNKSLENATDLAVGFNKALVAGGASDRYKNTAMYQMNTLLATGTLPSQRSWNAFFNGMGISVKYLAQEFGYGADSIGEFRQAVAGGAISGQELIKGIEQLADSAALDDALGIYKTTIASGLSNIKFAATRGFANIFTAVDTSLTESTGKGISGYMLDLRDSMNDVFADVAEWIKDNPDKITGALDRIRKYDWKGLVGGIGKNIQTLAKVFLKITDLIPDGLSSKFIAFSAVLASPLGKGLTAFSKVLKTITKLPGLDKIVPKIKIFSLFGKGKELDKGITDLGNFKSKFANLGLAAGMVAIVAGIGGVIAEFTAVAKQISNANINERSLVKNGAAVVTMIGVTSGIATALTAATTAISMTGIGGAGLAIGEGLAAGMIALVAGIGLVIDQYANLTSKLSKLKVDNANIKDSLSAIDDIVTNINLLFTKVGGITLLSSGMNIIGGAVATLEAFETNALLTQLTSVVKKLDTLNSLKVDTDMTNFKTSISLIGTMIKETYDALDMTNPRATLPMDIFGKLAIAIGNWITEWSDSSLASVVTDFNNTITSVVNTVKSLQTLSRLVNKNDMDKSASAVEQAMATISASYERINSALTTKVTTGSGTAERKMTKYDASSTAEMMTSLQSTVDSVKGVVQSYNDIQTNVAKIRFSSGYGQDSITTIISKVVRSLGTVQASITNQFGDGSGRTLQGQIKNSSSANDIFNNLASVITNVDNVAQSYKSIQSTVSSISFDSRDRNNINSSMSRIVDSISRVNTSITTKLTNKGSKQNLAVLENVQKAVDQLNATAKSMNSVTSPGDQVKNAIDKVREALSGDFSVMNSGAANLKETIRKLNFGSIAGTSTSLSRVSAGVASLNNSLGKVTAPKYLHIYADTTAVAAKIKALKELINGVKNKSLTFSTNATTVAGQIATIRKNVANISGKSVKINVSASSNAFQNIANIKRALDGIPKTKTVTINVKAPSNSWRVTATRERASTGGYISNRGVIYRSGGGFIPRGTDTVPAMLTPGEYVMNRVAVNKFGTAFMQRLNNLDLRGAISQMRGNTTNNNTDNSQRSVVINNYSSSDSNNIPKLRRALSTL